MAIDGLWKLNVMSPLGPLESELDAKSDGGALSGVQRGAGEEKEIYNGSVNGNAVAWSVDVTQPMPVNLTFNGTLDGDRLEGKVKAGSFGEFPFSGARA